MQLDPGTVGRGFALALVPEWGGVGMGGAERLWSARDAGQLACGGYGLEPGMRRWAETSSAFRVRGSITPFVGMTSGAGVRDLLMGLLCPRGEALQLGVEATRRESEWAPPDQGVLVRASVRW